MEQFLLKLSIMLVPGLLAVTLHEVAHGYVADKFGDPTARMLGRLTLNPIKHIDPIGVIALLLFGFGWARPVPITIRNLRNPKKSLIWVSIAGPVSNIILAILSAIMLKVLVLIASASATGSSFTANLFEPLALMAAFSLYINVILAVFNMIPIPPLDGGRVLTSLLPAKQSVQLSKVEPIGFLVVIFLVFFTPLWGVVLQPIINVLVSALAGVQTIVVIRAMSFLFGN